MHNHRYETMKPLIIISKAGTELDILNIITQKLSIKVSNKLVKIRAYREKTAMIINNEEKHFEPYTEIFDKTR